MVSENTYEYLTGVLKESLLKAYPGFRTNRMRYGSRDKIVVGSKLAHLRGLFKGVICRSDKPMAYVLPGDGLHIFNGRFYENVGDGNDFMSELVERTLRELEVGEIYQMMASDKIARAIVRSLNSSDRFKYEPDYRYIAFENGLFDLGKGKLTKFSADRTPKLNLAIEYCDSKTHYVNCGKKYGHADNPCRLWDRFIMEVLPEKQFRDAFQMFCGMLLVNRDEIKVEYLCLLHGPGSNGKSVLTDCICRLLGDRYYSTFTMDQLFRQGSSSGFALASLGDKVINHIGDIGKNDLSGSVFKAFVSGEKPTVAKKNSNNYVKINPPLMIGCSNFLPCTTDDSKGWQRRILPIRSTDTVYEGAKRDPRLTFKLTQPDALAYIFSWVYDGYVKVMKNNGDIAFGEDVKKAIEYVMNQSNSMRRWWNSGFCRWRQCREGEQGEWLSMSGVIFPEYARWCHDNGEDAFASPDLGRMLHSIGFSKKNGNFRPRNFGVQYYVREREKDILQDITE